MQANIYEPYWCFFLFAHKPAIRIPPTISIPPKVPEKVNVSPNIKRHEKKPTRGDIIKEIAAGAALEDLRDLLTKRKGKAEQPMASHKTDPNAFGEVCQRRSGDETTRIIIR